MASWVDQKSGADIFEALILPWLPPTAFCKCCSPQRSPPAPSTSGLFPALRDGRACQAPWVTAGAPRGSARSPLGPCGKGTGQRGLLSRSRRRRDCWGGREPGRIADQLWPRTATGPSARTKGRGPRTRLSLQALRTRPNPSATAETATPLSPLLPSGPVAPMTPFVHARLLHSSPTPTSRPSFLTSSAPPPSSERSVSANGRQGAPAARSGPSGAWV